MKRISLCCAVLCLLNVVTVLPPGMARGEEPPTEEKATEAYNKKDFKNACPYFEKHANDQKYGNGNDGYAKAISCYYHWARESEDKWDDVAALWEKVKTRCQAGTPCSITADLFQKAAADMASAVKSSRELRRKAADSSASLNDYAAAAKGAVGDLGKLRVALGRIADGLKIAKLGKPEEIARAVQAKIDALDKELARLKAKEAEHQKSLDTLGQDRDAWKIQALQAAQDANEWRKKYYDLLSDSLK